MTLDKSPLKKRQLTMGFNSLSTNIKKPFRNKSSKELNFISENRRQTLINYKMHEVLSKINLNDSNRQEVETFTKIINKKDFILHTDEHEENNNENIAHKNITVIDKLTSINLEKNLEKLKKNYSVPKRSIFNKNTYNENLNRDLLEQKSELLLNEINTIVYSNNKNIFNSKDYYETFFSKYISENSFKKNKKNK